MYIYIGCWGSLHSASCLVYRPLVPLKPLRGERIPSLQTFCLWGLWFKQPLLFLLLLRCQWMCNWLPPLRPQLCVRQPAGELQMWVPEWLRVCRRPAYLHLWVPTRAPDAWLFPLGLHRSSVAWFSRKQTIHMERTQSYGSVQSCVLGFCFCLGFCCCCVVLFNLSK